VFMCVYLGVCACVCVFDTKTCCVPSLSSALLIRDSIKSAPPELHGTQAEQDGPGY
jgi:hypothetical protein